ncbi:MAG TPA: apolipoprotein N-acyltransferase [Frankiaceae bacterium]|jgi:apolipoprotein N-acyltransferase|nr:apolipoprotein N-acyltransferase [Frankiaceae bacterium]
MRDDPSTTRAERLLRGVLAVVAGLLTYAAFPPFALRPLAVAGTALLLVAVRGVSVRRGVLLAFLYGLAFFVPLLSWLQIGAGTHAWVVLALLEAAFVGLSGAALVVVTRLPAWPVWAAAVFVAQEALRGRVPFGGFTWGRLGFSQDAGPLLRWSAVGGPALTTFAVALVAGLMVVAVRHAVASARLFGRGSEGLAVAAALAAALPVALSPLVPDAPRPERRATVALVQGNVPRLGLASLDPRQQELVIRNHVEATFELATEVEAGRLPRPDFVVWPENSTDRDPRKDAAAGALVDAAVKRVGVPVLVGAVLDRDDGEAENAGVVWHPATGAGATYAKRHLVPFGEYVPFRERLTPIFGRLSLVGSGFVPGAGDGGVLDIAGTRVGDVICFEVAYDDLVRDGVDDGAEVIVVQTNNASFGRSAQTRQQLAMSRVRAVEHGRTVLVAATSGVSAVIAPDGSTVDESAIWTRDLLVREVGLARSRTLATRAGAWPEAILAAMAGAAVLAGSLVARRRAGS